MGLTSKLVSLALVVTLSAVAVAQQPLSNWANVENLKHGTSIVVTTRNGREFTGVKRQSTGDSLLLEAKFAVQGNRTISLARDEIAQVNKMKSKWMYPLIGLGVGIAAGVAIGDTADHRGGDDPGLGKVVGGLLGGTIGLGTGAALSRKPGTKTIYVAP
jgi:hypothetical protein